MTAQAAAKSAPRRAARKKPTRKTVAVIVPVYERCDDLARHYADHVPPVQKRFSDWEFIYVLDGPHPEQLEMLKRLKGEGARVRIIQTHRAFGEAAAVMTGLRYTESDTILLLAPYYQVEADGLGVVLDRFAEGDADLVAARREPRVDTAAQRFQNRAFHRLVRAVSGTGFKDIACGVKVVRREVLEVLRMYGDQYRFLTLLATSRGFRVREVPVPQSPLDVRPRIYRPGIYTRRLLDLATILFLFKFTEKPLRFFGLIGLGLGGLGGVIMLYLGVYRLLGLGPLANRPLLILGTLLFVLGAQALSIGLLGELFIYTQNRSSEEALAEEIVPPDRAVGSGA